MDHFYLVRPAPEKKLPVILSVAEVRQILGRVRLPRYKVCLTTIYSCDPVLPFPAEGRNHIDLARSTEPMSKSSVQDAFHAALKESGNNKLRRAKEFMLRRIKLPNALPPLASSDWFGGGFIYRRDEILAARFR